MSPETLLSVLSFALIAAVAPQLICRTDEGDLTSTSSLAIASAILAAIAIVQLLAMNEPF